MSSVSQQKNQSNEVFGYGSLILPTSVMARFEDEVGPAKPLYKEGLEYGEKGILREKAVEAWEEEKQKENRIEMIPVKIEGFRRNYTWEKYGGTMLEAEHTGNPEDIINGVVIQNLNDEQYNSIASSEEGYGVQEIQPEDIETYINNTEIEKPVTIYTESDDERSNFMTSRTRSSTYHGRILEGIDMIKDQHGKEIADEFRKDFVKNTYENPIPGNSFDEKTPKKDKKQLRRNFMNSVEQQNNALKAFNQLFSGQK